MLVSEKSIRETTNLGNTIVVRDVSDLPDLQGTKILYADFETDGFHPWLGNRACGIGVTADDLDTAWYVPWRHADKDWNLPEENVKRWLQDVFSSARAWTNHNVKFDLHFLFQSEAVEFNGELRDTVVLAKLVQSDRLNYGLKPLCREWLDTEMSEEEEVVAWINGSKKEYRKKFGRQPNYADVPADMLGVYACKDVFAARALERFLMKKLPESVTDLWETEKKFTRVLFDMETRGLRVDLQRLKVLQLKLLRDAIRCADRLHKLTKMEYTSSSAHNHEILCGQLGLPVLKKSQDTLNPSFDKEAMQLYSMHPQVVHDERTKEIVDLILEYREKSDFVSRYLNPWQEFLSKDGKIHTTYNQLVRTGRTSCSHPPMQGVSPEARELIIPDHEDQEFVSADASQVEFRIIVHYLNDMDAIRAYQEDPRTDFHQWVADFCSDIGLKRKHAKNVNFAISYGAGKRKILLMLASDPDIVEEIGLQISKMNVPDSRRRTLYETLCLQRAGEIYETYHERFAVRRIANVARDSCLRRGFVFNLHGRRRHLSPRVARKAFNSVVQGEAMDYIKERMVALSESGLADVLPMIANVHDEILFLGEKGSCQTHESQLHEILQDASVPYRVPMRWDVGYGSTWRIAAGK